MAAQTHTTARPSFPLHSVSLVTSQSSSVNDSTPGRIPATHGRLHKRGGSASISPQSSDHRPFDYNKLPETPKSMSEEPRQEYAQPAHATPSAIKVKPYLRKLSHKDNNTIDLSRTAAENESLAGLRILNEYNYNSPRSASDVTFSPLGGRVGHNRSTSNNSQFSTGSASQRPSGPYTHPMRQTPRPYTPPVAKSYPTSIVATENSGEEYDIMSDDEFRYRAHVFDPARRSGSISSIPTGTQLLSNGTASSLRFGNQSQTSLSSPLPPPPPPAGRARKDTIRSFDTATGSTRTSIDKTFGFIRGRDSPVNPSSRAASIQAARIAYREKEEAKDRKAEKEEMKKREKEDRRRERQDGRRRRRSSASEEPRFRSRNVSREMLASPIAGKEYSNLTQTHNLSLPAPTATGRPASRRRTNTDVSAKRSAQSNWLGFMAWFKTRLLRVSRRLGISS
ncbi:hypothetical protein M501DRAFT_1011288 [Patellaria atrata CBS 101060]|uniref:Uncharacterized protein n=1 Tax=Patellaria atrata CBS 101060 TaxID=1346257 RepID=A0A9P4VN90_9PEZI|nr:hypothetical protein M501DRAFT_1011288 [Patellaria atrata CBS 101060]